MGSKWTVQAWTKVGEDDYRDVAVWQGESLIRALLAMRRAKRTSGCVSLEWRS